MIFLKTLCLSLLGFVCLHVVNAEESVTSAQRLQFFKNNKFGMFVTFGAYSQYEGWYKGRPSKGMAEWILKTEKIPVPEYKAMAKKFNPVNFDAKKIVSTAKNAGMKWIVFMARHHDCFAMFDTKTTDWNIVDASAYGKDIFKELADECRKQGIKMCCLYTIGRNWVDPIIADQNYPYKGEEKKYWETYYQDVVKIQIREILTNYGDIGMMWFDSPIADLSYEIADYVHSIQANCVVNGRVGAGAGDFNSTYDSTIKSVPADKFWEFCSTISESWAYRRSDNPHFGTAKSLVHNLVDVAGKNGMNLLDIALRADGSIQEAEVERLKKVGKWMDENSEAFHSTTRNPYDMSFDFGSILVKDNKMFLHFFGWPQNEFNLYGLKNNVSKAYILKSGVSVPFKQSKSAGTGFDRLELELPKKAPDMFDSVIVIELDALPTVAKGIVPQANATVVLEPALAKVKPGLSRTAGGAYVEFRSDGRMVNWFKKKQTLIWDKVYFAEPGTYDITFIAYPYSYRKRRLTETASFTLEFSGADQLSTKVTFDKKNETGIFGVGNKVHAAMKEQTRGAMHWTSQFDSAGTVNLSKPGLYRLQMKLDNDLETQMRFRQLRLHKR